MSNTQEKVKGRARINVDPLFLPEDIQTPVYGCISFNMMEVKEVFEQFRTHLLLPEEYTIVGVYFDVSVYRHWVIMVESEAIPLPESGALYPILTPTYQRLEDGTVRVADMKAWWK